ncbi:MAG TPA: hypothetical protein DEP28_08160, partial [Bacteroidetes bacterium]|nr:hypothetical protein [Bacteroidota bacterium]
YFFSIFFKFLSGNLSEIYIQNNSNELVDVELNNFLNAFILIKEIPHEIYGTDSPIPTYIYKKEILIVNITFDRFTFCRIINEEIEKNIKLLSE